MNQKRIKTAAIILLLMCSGASAQYNETTLYTVREFLDELPNSTWGGACSMYARYTAINAETANISLGEVTIKDYDQNRVRRTVCSGHRINYFVHNGSYYYVDNIYDRGRIMRYWELQPYIKESFGINLSRVGFTDWKRPHKSTNFI